MTVFAHDLLLKHAAGRGASYILLIDSRIIGSIKLSKPIVTVA